MKNRLMFYYESFYRILNQIYVFPQPRDRFDIWRSGHSSALSNNSARFSSGTGSSCSSVPQSPGSSIASPFHDAKASNPYDVSEYQPLNVIEGKKF